MEPEKAFSVDYCEAVWGSMLVWVRVQLRVYRLGTTVLGPFWGCGLGLQDLPQKLGIGMEYERIIRATRAARRPGLWATSHLLRMRSWVPLPPYASA